MISEKDLQELTNDKPEVVRAYYEAVNAVTDYQNELAAIRPCLSRNAARLKKKQFAATTKLVRFAQRVVFNGRRLSQEDKVLVRHWAAGALK
jgi:hypothetical protein